MTTPESIAEIGAGAEGCASGSQAWNGTSAALSPKPIRKNAAARSSAGFISAPPKRVAISLAASAMLSVPVTA
mgnify:CR=1 FL=1